MTAARSLTCSGARTTRSSLPKTDRRSRITGPSSPELERHVLGLRLAHGLTQREISRQIVHSQTHVSRVLRRSMRSLNADWDTSNVPREPSLTTLPDCRSRRCHSMAARGLRIERARAAAALAFRGVPGW